MQPSVLDASYTQCRYIERKEFMYEQISCFQSLYRGFRDANHGKLHNPAANKFEIRLLEATVVLSDQLIRHTYKPDRTTRFKIYYPKERDIETSSFKDKVVLHSLCDNVLYPVIQPSFIYDNYASQIGKGREFGLERFKYFMRNYFFSSKATHEAYLRSSGLPPIQVEQGGYADGWVLKCDIKKYFANIRHDLVKEKVKKYISDPEVLWLLDMVIDSLKDPGLPIGFQSSSLLSLLLLNDFDHMIKEKLHIKYYGRYADDFFLIHRDKEYLQHCLRAIRRYLAAYGLELNEKTQIFPLRHGVDFLGFHTYITDSGKIVQKIRKRSKDNARRKLKKFSCKLDNGEISTQKIEEFYKSWRAYASGGNTRNLIRKMDALYTSLFYYPKVGGEISVLYQTGKRHESGNNSS